MENTVTAGVLAQLLRLSPEARRVVAYALLDEEPQPKEASCNAALSALADDVLDLSLSIGRIRAVAECFADDYVDTCNGITCAMAVAHTEEHYENLYNALQEMIVAADKKGKALTDKADRLYKESAEA